MKNSILAPYVVILWAAASGCVSEIPPEQTSGSPSWEEFRQSVQQDSTGAFIVDGDIPLWTEEDLRSYYLAGVSAQATSRDGVEIAENPLLIKSVDNIDVRWQFPDSFNLTYCVDTSSFGTRAAELLSALDRAASSWRARVGVRFERLAPSTCDTSTDVVFNVRQITSSGFFARAFFPDYARAARELLVDESAFTTTAGGRDLEGILRHELGHAIGFRHEHIRLEPACESEPFEDARELTEYDVNSVMHYPHCRPSGTGGYRQSELDYAGAISVYGLSPQLILAIGS